MTVSNRTEKTGSKMKVFLDIIYCAKYNRAKDKICEV